MADSPVKTIIETITNLTVTQLLELRDSLGYSDGLILGLVEAASRAAVSRWTGRENPLATNTRKIMAIKLVREATGLGLKEAKEFVEGLHSITLPYDTVQKLRVDLTNADTGFDVVHPTK